MRISDWSSRVLFRSFDAARDDGAATGDREHVLDRHQERLVERALGLRDIVVHRLHQLENGVVADLLVAVFKRGEGRALDHGDVVAREIVRGQQLANLELDERSEEHTSELQSLMRISYAVFCLQKKIKNT